MGSNRRYPELGPRLAEERELREAARTGPICTLTDEQLGLTRSVVSIPPANANLWGLAWLRFGTTDVRASVRVKRWTDNAVGVEVDVDGTPHRCWVWQGAVQPLNKREDAWK